MVQQIDVKSLKTKLDNNDDFLLLDVRGAAELAIAKIEKSVHIEMNSIPYSIDDLDKDKEIVVMCRSGMRSMQVAGFLEAQGFSNVQNLSGGILAWADQIDQSMQTY